MDIDEDTIVAAIISIAFGLAVMSNLETDGRMDHHKKTVECCLSEETANSAVEKSDRLEISADF